ncbi:MAG TPA: hypothetical protein VEY91_11270 [Candidatus Limnocylindria bacterium]|nr:hypothetical protein [Candidatus Limnocylindria bacterium]
MPEYVPKLRTAVRLGQPAQEPVLGFLSLAQQAEFHSGPETILERLNAPDRVIPFHRHEDGAMLLVSRLDLEWVAPGRGVDPEWVCPPTYLVTREERVSVRFRSGLELEGLLRIEQPEMVNRASDFLNGPEDFFALMTADGVVLINKRAVLDCTCTNPRRCL